MGKNAEADRIAAWEREDSYQSTVQQQSGGRRRAQNVQVPQCRLVSLSKKRFLFLPALLFLFLEFGLFVVCVCGKYEKQVVPSSSVEKCVVIKEWDV